MDWDLRRFLIAGSALLVAAGALAAEVPTPGVTRARTAARANAASTQGREWMRLHKTAVGSQLIPVLNGCLPDNGDEVTAFSVYVRLTQKGRVLEVVTDLDAALGTCMTAAAKELQLPQAPRDDYWIQLNLATEL
jgi:hypothetical protein